MYIYIYRQIHTYTNIYIYTPILKDVFCNFLDFTRCHCLLLFPVFLNKKPFAFQSIKKSYLKLQLSSDISFAIPFEFHQFDEIIYSS